MITLIAIIVSGAFDQSGLGFLFGVGSVIFFPIFYGIGGFTGGLILALIYNFAAKFGGGIEMEFGM